MHILHAVAEHAYEDCELVIDTVVCLTLANWETASGRFGGSATEGALLNRVRACTSSVV